MNTRKSSTIEWIQGGASEAGDARRWRRWKTFLGVLLVATAVGLAVVYARTPLYRASASVLTVPPKPVDRPSEAADLEHVAIQRRLLLGEEIIGRLVERLRAAGDAAWADPVLLAGMLTAEPVSETNLLELRAEGGDPAALQRLVNAWAESYREHRAEQIDGLSGRTSARLAEEQADLEARIAAARVELQEYRLANDIVSGERPENRSLARLNGLNDALNRARARLAEATARLAAVQDALAKGEVVVPPQQKADLTRQQLEVERLRDRLAELGERYTDKYLERDPVLRGLPQQLRELERGLTRARELAASTALAEARQEAEAAQRTVAALQADLETQQRDVHDFNERFTRFQVLEEALARLEALHADNAERLARIELQNSARYPAVEVVSWATLPKRPLSPDYDRDLLIALAAALGTALFLTWLFEYLGERTGQRTAPYTGMRIFATDPDVLRAEATATGLAAPRGPALSQPPPKELSTAELQALLAVADPITAGCAILLLVGVAPQEFALLHAQCLDRAAGVLSVPGAHPRDLELNAAAADRVAALFATKGAMLSLTTERLDGCLAAAAAAAGLADPQRCNAQSLRRSCALFLIRQGVGPADLPARLGPLDSDAMAVLAAQKVPVSQPASRPERLLHPALLD